MKWGLKVTEVISEKDTKPKTEAEKDASVVPEIQRQKRESDARMLQEKKQEALLRKHAKAQRAKSLSIEVGRNRPSKSDFWDSLAGLVELMDAINIVFNSRSQSGDGVVTGEYMGEDSNHRKKNPKRKKPPVEFVDGVILDGNENSEPTPQSLLDKVNNQIPPKYNIMSRLPKSDEKIIGGRKKKF